MKEKIITTLHTFLTPEQVQERLKQITVEKVNLMIDFNVIRYYGKVHSGFASLLDVKHFSGRKIRTTYILKFSSTGQGTQIIVSNDSVSRLNDSLGYIIIMAMPIGLILILCGIFLFTKEGATLSSILVTIFGTSLSLIPLFIKPNINKNPYVSENKTEIQRLCQILDAKEI